MYDLLRRSHAAGDEPWASMYAEGHGEHWKGTAEYVARYADVWGRAINE
jgi:hypothetical protein